MRSTALAFKNEYDEVPVSSQEVLESNVAAIRVDLNELKTDFRAAIARIDRRIDAAVSKLEAEIRAMAAKAADDIKQLAQDMREMRGDDKALRDKTEKGYETLNTRIDKNFETLNTKIDKNHETATERFNGLDRKVDRIGVRLAVLIWLIGGLGTSAMVLVTVGKALKWF